MLAELVKRGYRVLLPFGDGHRYDMVIDTKPELVRAQVKTGRWKDGAVVFNATNSKRRYDGEADVFLVYSPHTEQVYWVPVAAVKGHRGYLRVTPAANNQKTGILKAEQFVF